jgi:hypothetical protein
MHLFNMVLLECIGLGYEINTARTDSARCSAKDIEYSLGQNSVAEPG